MLKSRPTSPATGSTPSRVDQADQIVDKLYARQTIYPGQLLQTDLLRKSPPLEVDQAQVGVPLDLGEVPARPAQRRRRTPRPHRRRPEPRRRRWRTGLVLEVTKGGVRRLRQRRQVLGRDHRRAAGRRRPGRRRHRHRRARHRADRPRRRASTTPRSPTSPGATTLMALIAFASAKGSPGVSVTVAGLAQLWPRRAVVADLDPAGGDTGLRYRAENGDPLNPSTGLLSLGAAVRAGQNAALEDHLQTTAGGMRTLVGVTTPGQVLGLGRRLAAHRADAAPLHASTTCSPTVVASPRDRRRWRSSTRPTPSCWSAGGELEDIAHLRERLRGLQASLHLGSIDATPTGIAMVTSGQRHPRPVPTPSSCWPPPACPSAALGVIAEDRKAADALRTESGRNIRRSVLVRSLHDLSRQHQRPDQPDGPHPSAARARGAAMDQQLLRDLRKEVAESLSAQRREDAANGLPDDDLGGRAPVRPGRDRPGARGPRRPGDRRRPDAAVGRPRRPSSPRASTPRCTASAGCSRCSTTRGREHRHQRLRPRLRRATPTARRSGSRRSPRPTRSWSSWSRCSVPTPRSPAGRSTPPTRSSTCGCPTAAGSRP